MSSEQAAARRGLLFVVSAPSGTGKTTVVERLVHVLPDLALSRSYTSRAARPGETDGVDYNFVSRARFEEMLAADAFLEWADVFGNLYGTCATDAERDLSQGRDLVLVIDVQGARQVRQRCRDTVGVFVMPPPSPCSSSACAGAARTRRRRCSGGSKRRGPRSPPSPSTTTSIVNDALEACVDRLRSIVIAERTRLRSARAEAERIVNTFQQVS